MPVPLIAVLPYNTASQGLRAAERSRGHDIQPAHSVVGGSVAASVVLVGSPSIDRSDELLRSRNYDAFQQQEPQLLQL